MVDSIFISINNRLSNEINRLEKNSIVNLLIGITATVVAIAVLVFSLWSAPFEPTIDNFIIIFLPKITLSIFIELFSFYFLKLYKVNLEEIKYTNNEQTNIDIKILSLKTSLTYNLDSTNAILLELAQIERNYIIKKGESTIDIERSKSDNKLYEKIIGIFDNLKSKG